MLKKAYPHRCPTCGSRDFETEYSHDDDEILIETCDCCDCQYQWTCEYEFVSWREGT
jgi:hypothetical protein